MADADAQNFVAFARFVNQSTDKIFAARLKEYLDVDAFLRFVAVNAVLANLDSFVGTGHNYYLWIAPKTGLAHFLPWDLNETFGRHPSSGAPREQIDLSIRHPWSGSNRLLERVLAQPEWTRAYQRACENLLADAAKPERLAAQIDLIARTTGPVIAGESDESRAAFARAMGGPEGPVRNGPGSRPPYREDMPLKEWITGRAASIQAQFAGQREGTLPRDSRGPGGGPPGGGFRPPPR